MSPIGSVNPLSAALVNPLDAPLPKTGLMPAGLQHTGAPSDSFGQVLDTLVSSVGAKQDTAQAMTRKVLLGDTDQIHQSVIAMQEASVSFSLMVEVRNKLVESYQELMRMQV
jgi:flagellar hook-basal body complex protein FliE